MKKVLAAVPLLATMILLAGCNASKERTDAWVLYNHPGASILSRFGFEDDEQVYVLCQDGQIVILQTNRRGPPDILNTNALPPDRASCK